MGKTTELVGAALDWAVAKAEGRIEDWNNWLHEATLEDVATSDEYHPSVRWSHAGPIIEREGISILRCDDDWGRDENGYTTRERIPRWSAAIGQHGVECCTEHQHHEAMFQVLESEVVYGPTPLIAAMRCYVRSKLGETVELQVGAR